ncbi:MAG TPA: secretin N-terminal domain-containing protein, partial [Phycisphaerae bacterium]|nr:secretin N-terminal domain-containing protein [Phycisphaerae bacterium]
MQRESITAVLVVTVLAASAWAPGQTATSQPAAPESKDRTPAPIRAEAKTPDPVPVKPPPPDPVKPELSSGAGPAARRQERNIVFQYKDMPYVDVVRRFAETAGKPLIGDLNIEGSLTFFDAETYTYDEAFDTLNLVLSMRGYRLMEVGRYFQLVPLSQVPTAVRNFYTNPDATKGVRPGKVVTVLLPLKHMDPTDAAKLVVRKVSAFGSISPMPRGKGIILTDSVANIQWIRDFLNLLDTDEQTQRKMESVALKHASAAELAKTIENLFGYRAAMIRRYGVYRAGYEAKPVDASEIVNAVADARTNTIFLMGAGDQLAMAKSMAETLDREETESGDLKIFQLKNAKAEQLAKIISASLPKRTVRDPRGRTTSVSVAQVVADPGGNRLIVSAPREQMVSVEKLIRDLDEKTTVVSEAKVFRLRFADARQLAGVVAAASGRKDPRGQVISRVAVSADARTNALVVAGAPGDIDLASEIIKELDQEIPEGKTSREIHVVHVEAGDARQLAAALVRLFRQATGQRGADPGGLRVEAETATNCLIISAAPGDWPTVQSILKDIKGTAIPLTTASTRRVPLKFAKAEELYRALRTIYDARNRSRERTSGTVPVIISPSARDNSLLIAAGAEDHETLAALIQSMDVDTETAAEPIQIIYLKAADASTIVAMLKAMQPPVGRGEQPDVFIQADAVTNAIILRAPQSKRDVLEKMVTQLDESTRREARELRTLPLANASASAVVSILSQLYQNSMPGGRRSRGAPSVDPSAMIIVAAGPADKTILVEAPRTKLDQIAALVASIDQKQEAARQQVRTYQLTNSNASEVARSLARLFAEERRRQPASTEPPPRFEPDTTTN